MRDLSLLLASDLGEPRTNLHFKAILAGFQPTYFWDIGANVGLYSWQVVNAAPNTRIWLFEPDEKNLRLLRHTLAQNNLAQVKLQPVAVANQCGTVEFLVDPVSGATGAIQNDSTMDLSLHAAYGLKATRTVSCIHLDSMCEPLDHQRLLIKIDVEGAEDQVLRGASRILREVRPILFIECFERHKLTCLSDFNYQLLDLQEGGNWLAFPEELEERVKKEWLAR